MSGWVRVHRKLAEHPVWTRHRFTPGQAWVDLIMLASYADHVATQGNRPVEVHRGQVLTSQVALGKRWRWDRETVRRFFRLLESLNMCHIETSKATDTGYTLVTLIQYETYQTDQNDASRPVPASDAPSVAPSDPASMPHPCPTIKKGKKGKKKYLAGAQAPAGGDSPRKPSRGNGKTTDPNIRLVIDTYHQAFSERFGTPPPINGGKCGSIAKNMLRGRPVKEALWTVRTFFESPPPFYRDKGLYGLEHVLAAMPTLLARKAEETPWPRLDSQEAR